MPMRTTLVPICDVHALNVANTNKLGRLALDRSVLLRASLLEMRWRRETHRAATSSGACKDTSL